MKRLISMMVLALLAISATAQTTDRLSASSVLNYSSRGTESDKDLIEIFRYEAQLEGKRWNTNYYDEKGYYGAKTTEEKDAYMKKEAAMLEKYPADHRKLVIVQMPDETPFALTYDVKDTSLVVLKSYEKNLVWDKTKIKVAKMKVDVAMYDSIQMLHMLANYTAVPMDQRPFNRLVHFVKPNKNPNALYSGLFPDDLEFIHLHFVWGDKYAKTHNCESETAKILKRTFIHICWAVYNNNSDQLEMLEDTIHLLLTQYRRLLLPDVNVDGVLLDKSRRQ